jgi:hypothetical protein
MNKRLDGIEKSINELYLKHSRPGSFETKDDVAFERKDAIGLCRHRRNLTIPKVDTGVPDPDDYTTTPAEIDEALLCRKAMRSLFRHGDIGRLDHLEKKSLSSFSFGNNGFLLAPEMSNQVLRCIVHPNRCQRPGQSREYQFRVDQISD